MKENILTIRKIIEMLDDLLSRVSARPLAIVPRQVRGIYNCLKMAAVNTSIYENIYIPKLIIMIYLGISLSICVYYSLLNKEKPELGLSN